MNRLRQSDCEINLGFTCSNSDTLHVILLLKDALHLEGYHRIQA